MARHDVALRRPNAGVTQLEYIVLLSAICVAVTLTWAYFGQVVESIIGVP